MIMKDNWVQNFCHATLLELAWLGTDEVEAAGKLTGKPLAKLAKNGGWAELVTKAAKLGPFSRPKLCIAAACKIGGLEAIRIFSISASCKRFDLALRFWNQILTCVSVRFRLFENSARSAMDKYCFSRNFFSNCASCWVVNGVLGFLFGLCLRSVHRSGPKAGVGGGPIKKN